MFKTIQTLEDSWISTLKSTLHFVSQGLDPQLPTLTDRDHRTQISTPEASTDAVVGSVAGWRSEQGRK